jgi:hypothetical protein
VHPWDYKSINVLGPNPMLPEDNGGAKTLAGSNHDILKTNITTINHFTTILVGLLAI